jgi:very-short-patch-repair endonuclease
MTGAEFADFERQVDLVADGKPYRVDAVHLEARLIVEFDGKRNHLRPDRVLYDRKRDVRLASEGFLTLRFTGREVLADPEWCRRMILAVLAHRLSIPDRA